MSATTGPSSSPGVAADAPDLTEAERLVRRLGSHGEHPGRPAVDRVMGEYDRRGDDPERRRTQLCKALALTPDTAWGEAIENARSAGVVRDAEYRTHDRIADENKRLHAELARVRAAVTALADGWVADLSQEPLDDHGRIVHAVTKDHAREVRETLAQP